MIQTQAPALIDYLDEQPVTTTPSERLNKAKGVLFGLAVGNISGLRMEGWPHEHIMRQFPNGLPGPDPEEQRRVMDDDLAQAVDLGESLQHAFPMREFRRRLIEWKKTNGRGIGHTTRRVIKALEEDEEHEISFKAAEHIFRTRGIAPNGGVMRCAPVGVKTWKYPGSMVYLSARTCAITHFAPLCQWSCIIVNAIISSELKGQAPDIHRLLAACYKQRGEPLYKHETSIPTEILERIQRNEPIPKSLEAFEGEQELIGHTLVTLQMGLWAATTKLDFPEAVEAVIRAGGDTDTNAAVAGAILGARYGYERIPTRWTECIPQPERINQLAQDLLQAPQPRHAH